MSNCRIILVTGEFFEGPLKDGNTHFSKIVCNSSSEKKAIGKTVTISNTQIKYIIFLD